MSTSPEFRKTILIGLGGAGQQIVLRTKRFFLDTYGVVPPSVKILCLDTDDAPLSITSCTSDRTYSIEPSEFLHLRVDNPQEFIEHSSAKEWYIKPAPVSSICRGAGAIRQNGRLGFFRHVNEIKKRIGNLLASLNDVQLPMRMQDATTNLGSRTKFSLSYTAALARDGAPDAQRSFALSKGDTEIYVCGSVAGGTGSGTFVDIGILLRRLAPRALIHGFFLLPWAYRYKSFAHRVRQNAYAALAEIDNLQSIMYGDDRFYRYQVGYADPRKSPVETAPYDLFHVIDGRNDFGQNIDSVHDICEIVSNAVFLSMGSMRVNVTSVVDNLLAHISVGDPKLWNGRYARYSSLGVSSIHYPAVELHRLISASAALNLCRAALRELEEPGAQPVHTDVGQSDTQEDVKAFITNLNLTRNNVQGRLCPQRAAVEFEVQPYEISDSDFPGLIKDRWEAEKKAMEERLARGFEGPSRVFADEMIQAVERRLADVLNDPALNRSAQRNWISDLGRYVDSLKEAVAEQLVTATDAAASAEESANALLEIAEKSRYIPMLGGSRKSAVKDWAEAVRGQLNALQRVRNLEHEKAFYGALAERLAVGKTLDVPKRHELFDALSQVESQLQALIALEEKNLDVLRGRPNHVLLGQGRSVVTDQSLDGSDAVAGAGFRSTPIERIECDYAAFREAARIHTADDYLARYRRSPNDLLHTFLDYCSHRFERISEVTVVEALRSFAAPSEDPTRYLRDQFEHLFRLASPLWSFESGRLSEVQELDTGKVINIGFTDHERELPDFETICEDMRHAFHIGSDLAYSTTGDPHHIWMLGFAAAIPAYLISDMDRARLTYEEQITPSFHIDAEFEKELPDLFPESENAARALRILGMAIIPGLDVITDEKLPKGHRFTLDDPEANNLNYGEPVRWLLFRDMYNDVQSNQDGLLDIVTNRLKRRVHEILSAKPAGATDATATRTQSEEGNPTERPTASAPDPRQQLKALIERQIKKLDEKLKARDFSRLYSARLTYREIQGLRDFLDNKRYAMDIERYIQGSFVPRNHAQ